jgi:hypothetical protein
MVSICLLGLAAALTVVGLASGTVLRHAIQITPALAALAVMTRRPSWGAYAAIPIFALWIFIVALIWAFLLGLAKVVTGQFSAVEIICTVFMAGFSAVGIVKAISLGRPFRPLMLMAFVAFAALQVFALQISFLPGVAQR